MENILSRFLRYVAVDTQSDPTAASYPSTAKQLDLLKMLAEEMKSIGVKDVETDQWGYVTGTIPATAKTDAPAIGFIAHVDTSPDMPGAGIKPQIVEYTGGDIVLNKEQNIVLRADEFPELEEHIGHTLVTTDGTTLLGADDKAGIAEIMHAAEYLLAHPEIEHPEIRIAFTPDEEVGHGVDHFDVKKFGAKYAYTIDGSLAGELEFENFNAAAAKITIHGNNIHPGYAKDKMINSLIVAMEYNDCLPAADRPENTEGYEGFYHLMKMEGIVEHAAMEYIIRDHSREMFETRKERMMQAAAQINEKYGRQVVTVAIADQYYNMREMVEPHMIVVDTAKRAIEMAGIAPVIKPIRGGTDGCRLSYMGLPCPNIFAGGVNFHGKYEFVSVQVMEKAAEVIVNIAKLFAPTGRL